MTTITFLLAEIAVEPGWAVGSVPLHDPILDRDVLTDAEGRPWVPGSSLAGSLRAHLRGHDATVGTNMELKLMGSRPPKRGEETAVSFLWLLGTRFTADSAASRTAAPGIGASPDRAGASQVDAEPAIVGQTAIDRQRGAAAATSLRYSRSVASGGLLTAFLRYDRELSDDERDVLAAWSPTIGRDRTTGSGRARLDRLRYGTIDPAEPTDRHTWLTCTGEDLVTAVATTDIPITHADDQPWLEETLLIQDALLVGDPRPTGPALPRKRANGYLVPGTAWKGIFRSRVEYILRSRYGESEVCSDVGGCGRCPACAVFGHRHGRGVLSFTDSTVDTDQPSGPLPGYPPTRTQVGIDRVTGGVCAGLLFESAPLTAGSLRLRIYALGPVDEWVGVAVRHVLRDLHDGLIGVGSRVTRGMGTLRLAKPPTPPGPVVVPRPDPAKVDS